MTTTNLRFFSSAIAHRTAQDAAECSLYCLNGGTCETIENSGPDGRTEQCNCLPGYTGLACEYASDDYMLPKEADNTFVEEGVVACIMLALIVCIVLAIIHSILKSAREKRFAKRLAMQAVGATAELTLDLDEESSHGYGNGSIEIASKKQSGNIYSSAALNDEDEAEII